MEYVRVRDTCDRAGYCFIGQGSNLKKTSVGNAYYLHRVVMVWDSARALRNVRGVYARMCM